MIVHHFFTVMSKFLPIAFLGLLLLALGCAGGGGGSSSGGSSSGRPVCSTSLFSPNYILNRDPATGSLNRTLYWSNFPLRVAFRSNRTFPDGFGGTISVAAVAADAFGRWRHDTGGRVDFSIVGAADPAEITVQVVEVPGRPGAGGTLGQTQMRFVEPSGRLTEAEITLYVWPGITRAELTQGLRATSAHEFGHALFLLGHSENPADLMHTTINPTEDKFLTSADLNSLRTGYCDTFSRLREESRAPLGPIRTVVIRCSCGSH